TPKRMSGSPSLSIGMRSNSSMNSGSSDQSILRRTRDEGTSAGSFVMYSTALKLSSQTPSRSECERQPAAKLSAHRARVTRNGRADVRLMNRSSGRFRVGSQRRADPKASFEAAGSGRGSSFGSGARVLAFPPEGGPTRTLVGGARRPRRSLHFVPSISFSERRRIRDRLLGFFGRGGSESAPCLKFPARKGSSRRRRTEIGPGIHRKTRWGPDVWYVSRRAS